MFNIGDTVWVVSQSFDQRWVPIPSKIFNKTLKDDTQFYSVNTYEWGGFGEGLKLTESYTDKIFETKEECDRYISNFYYDSKCRGCKWDGIDYNWTCDDCKFNSDLDSCKKNGASTSRNEICKYYAPTLPQNIRNWGGVDWYVDLQKNCLYNKECSLHKNSIHKTRTYEQWANQFTKVYYPDTQYKGRDIVSFNIKNIDWWNNDFIWLNEKDGHLYKNIKTYGFAFAPLKTPKGKDKKGTCNFGKCWEEAQLLTIGEDNGYEIDI